MYIVLYAIYKGPTSLHERIIRERKFEPSCYLSIYEFFYSLWTKGCSSKTPDVGAKFRETDSFLSLGQSDAQRKVKICNILHQRHKLGPSASTSIDPPVLFL